ncbi:hypothetical protein DBT_0811 [Dissulfuribacter thermophilus]|uniref:Uncharacterized protein n=1 Tax=Dissulfuribacter thermophilus TaxID=1156395 RepID=A0A1B9F7I8_9BACT|nr:hypothetical protein DBT_0811 [Dissulfuribacter thermophilus]
MNSLIHFKITGSQLFFYTRFFSAWRLKTKIYKFIPKCLFQN